MTKVPYSYYKKLRSYGINAVLFQRYRWFVDVKMNNRDHRKIIVIDGHTSFTGGINLADEYVNVEKRFGEWKDNMIMMKGEATQGMTILFLSMWDNYLKEKTEYAKYSYKRFSDEQELNEEPKGYVQPYGDIPFDYESVGANVYKNLISRAKKSVLISTPYLILDESFVSTLITAARSGVDVKIILPGIPDKKTVYQLSIAYAYELSKYGIGIYFYKPGFNHMKTVLVDDAFASIGTINLDLRSFHLNYENAVLIYDGNCLEDIKKDFDEMLLKCKRVKDLTKKKISIFRRIWWAILKCLSPMF
jgi:cardiolipin synthase